jgi:hypothetical protein
MFPQPEQGGGSYDFHERRAPAPWVPHNVRMSDHAATSGEDVPRYGPLKVGGAILLAAGVAGFGVWVLFEHVVTNAPLVLDYLQVLAWPLVVVGVAIWLREPVRDKVRALLRLNALGASMEFQQDRTRRLEEELADSFEQLGALGEDDSAVLVPDSGQTSTDSSSERQTSDGEPQGAQPDGPSDAESKGSASATVPALGGGDRRQPTLSDLRTIGVALGMSDALLDKVLQEAGKEPEAARQRLITVLVERANLARQSAAQVTRPSKTETRESIEAVIRESAAWGYDMGRAGAGKTVPDVEWNPDGTWRITTEVPQRRVATVSSPAKSRGSDKSPDSRAVRELEDEIKKLERLNHSPLHGLGSQIGDAGWLHELKRRLRAVDPANPWAVD